MAVRLSCEYTAPDGCVVQADRTSLRGRIPLDRSRRTMLVDPENPKSLKPPAIGLTSSGGSTSCSRKTNQFAVGILKKKQVLGDVSITHLI